MHSEYVFIALVIQHAKRMHRIILSSVAYPALPYISTLSDKWHGFLEKVILYIKMNWFFLFVISIYGTYTNSHFGNKLCALLPLGLEETVGYVWARNS